MTISPLADPRAEAVLGRLHAEDARQFRSMLRRYLPRMILSPFIGSSAMDVSSDSDQAFLRDKLVALDADKGRLAYTFCRALDARRAVEVGTSFGVSTIYLAAALRDNAAAGGGAGLVTGTEIEPGKVAAARANLAEAGLDAYAQVREGDALQTLRDIDGPLDFVLIDTWIPLALPALKLLAPRMRHGAVVMCDNVRQFAKEYRDYTDYIRDPANGFRSMLWPGQGGVELSVRTAASVTS
jgi:predicted O-methyltransferase YrrM